MATVRLHHGPAKGDSVENRPAPVAALGVNERVSPLAKLYADTRGALLVEYSVLIGAIAIAASFGLVTVGIALVHSFDFVRGLILCPIP
jgi:Flp pilus assembly pilin Flp